jgi:hypothetical protein
LNFIQVGVRVVVDLPVVPERWPLYDVSPKLRAGKGGIFYLSSAAKTSSSRSGKRSTWSSTSRSSCRSRSCEPPTMSVVVLRLLKQVTFIQPGKPGILLIPQSIFTVAV